MTGLLFKAWSRFQSWFWSLLFSSYLPLSSISPLHLEALLGILIHDPENDYREHCTACGLRETTKQFCCESWFCSSHTSVVVIRHGITLQTWYKLKKNIALCLHFKLFFLSVWKTSANFLIHPSKAAESARHGEVCISPTLYAQPNTNPQLRKLSISRHSTPLKLADYNFEKTNAVTFIDILLRIWPFLSCLKPPLN